MHLQCVLFHSDADNDFVHVASLKPPNYKLSTLGNVRVPELKIYPAGAAVMDDIFLTALMIERIRLEKSVFCFMCATAFTHTCRIGITTTSFSYPQPAITEIVILASIFAPMSMRVLFIEHIIFLPQSARSL